jgi:tRNA (cmo5U34)-methyltransferase
MAWCAHADTDTDLGCGCQEPSHFALNPGALQCSLPSRSKGPRREGSKINHSVPIRGLIYMSNVGDRIDAPNADWRFGSDVPDRFDAHVRRSVPFYDEGHELIAKLSDFFVGPESRVYELGCSTGTLTRRLAERTRAEGVRFIAIDAEPAMVAVAAERCLAHDNVEVCLGDIAQLDLEPADMIVAYYTLQFVRPRSRQAVFDKLYRALNWGGALLVFEKVRAPDARFQDAMTQLYADFKQAQGYSDAEILSKARSLKGVLEPFSTQGNLDLMRRAGFVDIMTVYKYICFEGFLAIK